jgi:hypothetical protein
LADPISFSGFSIYQADALSRLSFAAANALFFRKLQKMLSKLKKAIPLPVKLYLYRLYSETAPTALSAVMGPLGYNVSRRKNFYSPLPGLPDLKRHESRWNKPSTMSGLNFDLAEMRRRISHLLETYLDEFMALPPYAEMHAKGFGLGYTPVDALTLYIMIRDLKPSRYLEVGSGLSTYYAWLSGEKNKTDGAPLSITCIEPYPQPNLYTLPGVEVISKEVQDVEIETFRTLSGGDVLFIDSSHVVRLDGDVPFLLLEVLPSVASGVNIHVHDIPFPYNVPYPAERWVFGQAEPMYWTEAMLLQAFLAFNPEFEIQLSLPIIRHADEGFLRSLIPIYETVEENSNAFSSIWLRRK